MLEVRYVADHGLRGERGPRLLRYLLQRGADELAISVMALQDTPAPFADAFEDEMAPFARGVAPRRTPASPPATNVVHPVRLWSFDDRSLRHLLSFLDDGLFHCPPGPDGWLEDLAIYRAGELVLGLVSHELEGVLCLTAEEHAEVARLDIPSQPTAEWIGY